MGGNGRLHVTDGAEVDYRYILRRPEPPTKSARSVSHPSTPSATVCYYPADEDLNPITIIQNYTNMSEPMKELEAAIESGAFIMMAIPS
ncbi:hypothetical protein ACLBR5_13215 [Escherichia coli]